VCRVTISPAFPLVWTSDLVGERGAAVVVIEGEIDRLTQPALRDHLDWLLSWIDGPLIIDAAGVTFADVAAHAMLVQAVERAEANGCPVVLLALGPALGRLFDVLGVPAGAMIDGSL
jgi:anti-anti-sigma factor